MAKIKCPLHDDGPVNAGEQRLLDYLSLKLPENYYTLIPQHYYKIFFLST